MTDFLSAARALLPSENVEVPELGMTVMVKGLTARQMNDINKAATNKKGEPDPEKITVLILAASLYYPDGSPLIDKGREDEVLDLPHEMISRLTRAVFDLNGMTGDELEGNS